MIYLKTKPTPGGRRRPTLALCLLVVLLTHDARALPRPQLLTHSIEVADVSSVGGSAGTGSGSASTFHQPRTAAQIADIAAAQPHIGVVVDWQSVCEHLCSSNLGGSGCGSHCVGSFYATQQNWIGNDILSGCPFLCSIRLGDSRCKCAPVLTYDLYDVSPTSQNEVCLLGCTTGNQLNGCSECPERSLVVGVEPSNNDIHPDYDEVTADAEVVTEPSYGRDDTSTDPTDVSDEDLHTTTETSDTTDPSGEPTDLVSDAPSTTTEAESTTTTTTAAPSTTTTKKTTTTQKTTTTPDWKELCQNLCRIGEGGALCNCDLPPFF